MPNNLYETRLREWSGRAELLADQEERFSRLRLALGLSAIPLGALSYGWQLVSSLVLVIPLIIFIPVAIHHESITRRRKFAGRAAGHYQAGMRRLRGEWAGEGKGGLEYLDSGHPFAADLDLFGHGSLFQLLCRARTGEGERRLADYLLRPASRGEAMARQQAVAELAPNDSLREDLALAGEDIRAALHPAALRKWGEAPVVRFPAVTRTLCFALGTLAGTSLAAYFASLVPLAPFLLVILMEGAVYFVLHDRIESVGEALDTPARELALLAVLLERVEREAFQSARMREQGAGLNGAAAAITRLERLVQRMEWAHNQFFGPIAFTMMWVPLHALAIEGWRRRWGTAIALWIESLGELEALSSLACYAFENPGNRVPELMEGGPVLDAEDITHPLLHRDKAVPNALRLDENLRLLVISGSNMSGKSTLLRAVGLNAILAWAGAPVPAKRLALSPFQLGASIRTVDSLQEGRSRFFAEITRLRQITGLTGNPPPVLFLIDELLSGTNSHDRAIGAEAILRGLLDRGAIGLATTHDLALTRIGETPPARNVHFEDSIEDGEVRFDYRLRPGVVTRSNALDLMRSIGLL